MNNSVRIKNNRKNSIKVDVKSFVLNGSSLQNPYYQQQSQSNMQIRQQISLKYHNQKKNIQQKKAKITKTLITRFFKNQKVKNDQKKRMKDSINAHSKVIDIQTEKKMHMKIRKTIPVPPFRQKTERSIKTSPFTSRSKRYDYNSIEMTGKSFYRSIGSSQTTRSFRSDQEKVQNLLRKSFQLSVENQKNKRFNLMTLTEKNNLIDKKNLIDKEQIINKIIRNDIEDYYKYEYRFGSSNPQEIKQKYQFLKSKELKLTDKYDIHYMDFVKNKSEANVEKLAYQQKVRKRSHFIEKFQDFILEEKKFSLDIRHKIEKSFKTIQSDFKTHKIRRNLSDKKNY